MMKKIKDIVNECIKKYINESMDDEDIELMDKYLMNLKYISDTLLKYNEMLNKKIQIISMEIESCKKFINSLNFDVMLMNFITDDDNGVKCVFRINDSDKWSEEDALKYSKIVTDNFKLFKSKLGYESNLEMEFIDDFTSEIHIWIKCFEKEYLIDELIYYIKNKLKEL